MYKLNYLLICAYSSSYFNYLYKFISLIFLTTLLQLIYSSMQIVVSRLLKFVFVLHLLTRNVRQTENF